MKITKEESQIRIEPDETPRMVTTPIRIHTFHRPNIVNVDGMNFYMDILNKIEIPCDVERLFV